jgi:hypothetical protein
MSMIGVEHLKKWGILAELGKQLEFKPSTISTQCHSLDSKLATLQDNHRGDEEEDGVTRNQIILFELI